MNEKRIIRIPGCDLGTTNSENGAVEVITNQSGDKTTPSLVYFSPTGERIVGKNAIKYMQTEPERVVYEVKRLMGRKFNDPEIQEFIKRCSYKIVSGKDGAAWVEVNGEQYSPTQISAFILQEMKKICEDYLSGEKVTQIVITVPAHFNDAQRQATKDAGTIAGLQVERIINEPTAASLAYGSDGKKGKGTVAVYDLGGGTFDISIINIDEGVFQVKATNGDTFLGRTDFDQKIVAWLLNEAKKQLGVDLSNNSFALRRLKDEAVSAKHSLSRESSYTFDIPYIAVDKNNNALHLEAVLLRKEFEFISQDLLSKLEKPCRDCLKDAGCKVDQVILVGGMTRTPMVQKVAENIFKMVPNKSTNPDETVAIGAAIQGSVLAGSTKDVLLLDVTPLSLGIETLGGVNTVIISRNTSIPTGA